MTEPLNLDLNLNAQGYIDNAGQALAATQQLDGGLRSLAVTTAGMQRVWGAATPSRAHVAMMTAYGGAAAVAQHQLSGLAGTQAVTHQSTQQLASGMRQLARDIPIGNQAAQQLVITVSQLGIVGDRSVQKINQVAQASAKLAMANQGTNANTLASSMVQLERTFGDQGIDPKRINATGDSLTYVSKMAGASAQSVLDLSNAIGPFAQASGIGKTATLGISAGLARIGQDGYSAANAISTLLQGINEAVKTGSPDLAKYANIIGGISPGQFQQRFVNAPTQTLTQLVTALGQGTPQNITQLDQLGLGGVRSQRAIQSLVASGGLNPAISQAVGAYGGGSTSKAAAAAGTGVIDNFTKVSASAEQVAIALGTPLLGPLEKFSSVLATVTGGIAHAAGGLMNNRVVRDVATAGGVAIAGGMLLRGRLPGLGVGALVGQGLFSSPVRGLAAGLAMGREGLAAPEEAAGAALERGGFLGRFGGPVLRRIVGQGGSYSYERPSMLTGRPTQAGGVTQAAANIGMGFREAQGRGGVPSAFSLPRRIWAGVTTPFAEAFQAYNRLTSEQMMGTRLNMAGQNESLGGVIGEREAQSPAMARGAYRTFFQGVYGAGQGPGGVRNIGSEGWAKDIGASFRNLRREIDPTTSAMKPLRGALSAFGSSLFQTGRTAGAGIGRGVGAIGSAFFGSPMAMGVTAAVGLGSFALSSYKAAAADRAEQSRVASQGVITDSLDRFNEAIGHATGNTVTFAQTIASAAKAGGAGGTAGLTFDYKQGNAQITSQINTMSAAGYDPQQVTALRTSLGAQGFTPQRIDQILKGVNRVSPVPGPGGGGQALVTQEQSAAGNQVIGAGGRNQMPGAGGGGIPGLHEHVAPGRASEHAYYHHLPGEGFHLSDKSRRQNTDISGNIAQRYEAQKGTYGETYAQQIRMRDVDTVMKAAASSGNEAQVNELGDKLARQFLPANVKIPRITSTDIQKYGGYIEALRAKSPVFRTQFDAMHSQGLRLNGIGLTPQVNYNPTALSAQQNMTGGNAWMATYYNNRLAPLPGSPPMIGPVTTQTAAANTARSLTQQFVANPESLSAQQSAAEAQVTAATAAGKSLAQVATAAAEAAGKLDGTADAAGKLSAAVLAEAQFRAQGQAPFQGAGANFMQQFGINAGLAGQSANTPGSQQMRAQGRQGLQDQMSQLADSMKQRLAIIQQYQVQYARTTEDFQRSQGRATQDFNTSQERATEDFTTQEGRAYQDYYTQQYRQQRDFQISLQRSQQDYLTQRGRSIRDFNKQLARDIQDQAQSLYDPYKRIQTQAVWDGRDLLTNLAEQNQKVMQQTQQLSQARGMGLSNTAIQLLGLNDPNNAQQLAKLINDMMSDPKLVSQLNQTSAARQSLGSILVTDPANKDIARAKQDFQTQLADMENDYNRSVTRARQDMAKQVADQEYDFGVSIARMEHDFQLSIERANYDMNVAMGRAEEDNQIALKRMGEDVDNANKQITGNLQDLWNATLNTMKDKHSDVQKLMQDGLSDTIKAITDKNNITQINNAYKNLFPYDLSKVFGAGGGTGGPNPGQQPTASLSGSIFGPWPVINPTITQQYGAKNGRDAGGHPGIDLSEPSGTPIVDELSGVVIQSGWNDGYGNSLTIDHGNGRTSLYGHMINPPNWRVGQIIKPGQQIGNVGSTGNSTGPHLHFELRQNGSTVDPAVMWPIWRGTNGPESLSALYGLPSLGPWGALFEAAFYQMTNGTETNKAGYVQPGGLPPAGDVQAYAMQLLQRRGWGSQWPSFSSIVHAEDANWDPHATNPQSGAYGIPQALPGDKMAIEGSDWRDNARTQVRWMINDYIPHQSSHFSTPDEAWAFHQRMGWYAQGAIFNGSRIIGVGESGPEAVIPLDQRGASMMAQAMSNVMTDHEIRQMTSSAYASPVTYHTESVTLDQRQIIEQATVVAQDPDEMGRKLAAKQRRTNLTGTKR